MGTKEKISATQRMKRHWDASWERVGRDGNDFGNFTNATIVAQYFVRPGELIDKSVLDVGCGSKIAPNHIRLSRRYFGLDLSAIPLRKAFEGSTNLHLVQGDAINLPFRRETFDVVLQFQTSHKLGAQFYDAIAESHRVLRKGGLLIFDAIHPDCYLKSGFNPIKREKDTIFKGGNGDIDTIAFEPTGVVAAVTGMGFKVEEVGSYTLAEHLKFCGNSQSNARFYPFPEDTNFSVFTRAVKA